MKKLVEPCAVIVEHGNLYADIRATDQGFGTFTAGANLYDDAAIAAAELAGRQAAIAAFIRACCLANVPYETMQKIRSYMPCDAFVGNTGATYETRK